MCTALGPGPRRPHLFVFFLSLPSAPFPSVAVTVDGEATCPETPTCFRATPSSSTAGCLAAADWSSAERPPVIGRGRCLPGPPYGAVRPNGAVWCPRQSGSSARSPRGLGKTPPPGSRVAHARPRAAPVSRNCGFLKFNRLFRHRSHSGCTRKKWSRAVGGGGVCALALRRRSDQPCLAPVAGSGMLRAGSGTRLNTSSVRANSGRVPSCCL